MLLSLGRAKSPSPSLLRFNAVGLTNVTKCRTALDLCSLKGDINLRINKILE